MGPSSNTAPQLSGSTAVFSAMQALCDTAARDRVAAEACLTHARTRQTGIVDVDLRAIALKGEASAREANWPEVAAAWRPHKPKGGGARVLHPRAS